MVSAVRAGDVYIVPIPGDNGEVKRRRVLVLEGTPDPTNPTVLLIVFGCSDTKRLARTGTYIRVHEEDDDFRGFGLDNSTTFHMEDIRFYDAASPYFAKRPVGRCNDQDRTIEFRELLDRRLDDATPIRLLPNTASAEAEEAATDYRRYAPDPEPESGEPRGVMSGVARVLAKKTDK